MTKREIIRTVLRHERPPYVPWSLGFTAEAHEKLLAYYGADALDGVLDDHILGLGSEIGFFTDIGSGRVRDVFGVVWNRNVDRDIGIVEGCLLPEPTLNGYTFPDPLDSRFFENIPDLIARQGERFRVFNIGFSLYERAWTLRGMENLMMDFIDKPAFVHELLGAIADYNIAQIRKALEYDIDAVHFGDDWGQQHGLQMSPAMWREFIRPQLKRMYGAAKASGKFVTIHSCGDVDELFDDLIAIGVDCFNPFQPEVMDVGALFEQYRGRLAFHGGMSTQKTLPYGTVEDVKAKHAACWTRAATADTSSPPPTRSKATCPSRTWPPSSTCFTSSRPTPAPEAATCPRSRGRLRTPPCRRGAAARR